MLKIVAADSPDLLQHAITLSQEYVTWMLAAIRENYPELNIAEFAAAHEYDDVHKKFPGEHVPPFGRLLVAIDGGTAAGCIALGRLSDTVCEMRTLFVRPAARGTGAGRQLVETVLAEARAIGYSHMRLDSLRFMEDAYQLYRSLGFYEIAPYRELAESLKPYIRFLEVRLHP